MVVHIDLLLLISFTFPQFWLKSPWTFMGAEGLKDSSTFEWSSSLMFIYGFIGASICLSLLLVQECDVCIYIGFCSPISGIRYIFTILQVKSGCVQGWKLSQNLG